MTVGSCFVFRALIVGAATILAGANGARARDFTYAGWGGGLQDAQREAFLKPMAEATKKPVKEDVYLGGTAKFEAMKASKDVVWDVVNVEADVLQRGCDDGTFLKLDYAKVGTAKDAFIPGAAADCGIGSYTWAFALAYDASTTKEAPQTLADFWNIAKWPGRRGLRKGPLFNMELALLADGVAPEDVYKTLATPEGRDRAFKKLDQIKSQVVWWEAPAQTAELLSAGTVAMIIAPNARISAAVKAGKDFKMVFKPGMIGIDYWVVVNGSPEVDAAYTFLKIATAPKAQADFSNSFAYGPTVKAATPLLAKDAAELLPVGDTVSGALNLSSSEANSFWADNADELNERWNAWLAR